MTLLVAAPPPDEVGGRILDAALAEFTDFGLRRVNMDDVARRAGVVRTTVYRRFGTKPALVQATMAREVSRLLAAVQAAVVGLAAPADAVAEAFTVALRTARAHPLLTRLLATEPETLLPYLTTHGGPLIFGAAALVADQYLRDLPLRLAPEAAAELLIRLGISLVLTPDTRLPLADRAFVHEHLVRPLLAP